MQRAFDPRSRAVRACTRKHWINGAGRCVCPSNMPDQLQVVKALAIRIRDLRAKKGWSQERLAEEAAIHRTYLGGIERGLRNPALRNLVKIARALDVSMSELFQESKTA